MKYRPEQCPKCEHLHFLRDMNRWCSGSPNPEFKGKDSVRACPYFQEKQEKGSK